jgi:hypothetical protein
MNLENNVKEWVKYDTLIKQHMDEINKLKQKKTYCEKFIYEQMKDRNKYPTINITDGTLKMGLQSVYQPLSFKYIESCLGEKFSKSDLEKLINDLREKRDVKSCFYIKRSYK